MKMRSMMMVLLLPLAALAGEPQAIQQTRPLAADGKLRVENPAGSLEISAWDRNEVMISGELGENAEPLEIRGDARDLQIVVRYPSRLRGSFDDSELRLRVPARVALELKTVSAQVQLRGVKGPLQVQSVSGDLNLDVGSTQVQASTVSGDLQLRAPAQQTKLSSVSGDIVLRDLRGTLNADTVSGQLQVEGGPFKELSLQSVSGDLQLNVALDANAQLRAETLSGDIGLELPRSSDASLELKTFSGELHNEFGGGEHGLRKMSAKIGGGRGQVSLHSFSGDISVRPVSR